MESSVLLQRLHERHPFLHDADGKSADDIDQRDEDSRDGIAADELARAVHRSVKVSLLLHLDPALRRGGLVDESGVEFRINGHLLAGQRVEREACGDFRDPARALRDDHEIDDDQNEEDDRADDVVPAHDERTERLDDRARVPFGEDEARGGDVEREAVERHREQQRGERGKLRRILHVDDDEQHQQRDADARSEEQIEHHRRHRHDEQDDRAEEREDEEQIAALEQREEIPRRDACSRCGHCAALRSLSLWK